MEQRTWWFIFGMIETGKEERNWSIEYWQAEYSKSRHYKILSVQKEISNDSFTKLYERKAWVFKLDKSISGRRIDQG